MITHNRRVRCSVIQSAILILVALLTCAPACAADLVRVGFFKFDGYHELDAGGKRGGYGYDFLSLVRRYADVRYEYVGYERRWEDMRRMLLDGEIDMVTPARRTPERQEEFDFSMPIGTSSVRITARAGDGRYVPGEFATYEGMRIGLIRGSAVGARVEAFARRNGFSFRPVYLSGPDEIGAAFESGRIDAAATSSLRRTEGERTLSEFDIEHFHAIVRKGDARLLGIVNDAIRQMDAAEGDWRGLLVHGNYEESRSRRLVFNEEERRFIERHSQGGGKVVVAGDGGWAPFCSKGPDGYAGILPDYVAAVMRMAGIRYEYVGSEDSYDVNGLRRGEADIYVGYGLDPSTAERAGLVTSPAIMRVGASFLVRRDAGAVLTVGVSDVNDRLNAVFRPFPGQEVRHYGTAQELSRAVMSGEVDAGLLYTFEAMRLAGRDVSGILTCMPRPGLELDLRAAIGEDGDRVLLGIVSKCIRHIHGATVDAIVSRHLSLEASDLDVSDWVVLHQGFVFSVFFVVLLLVIVVLMVRQKEKERANRNLQESLRNTKAVSAELGRQMKEVKELNSQLDDTAHVLVQVQKVLKAGMWRMTCGRDGSVVRIEIGDEIREVLGIAGRKDFPDTLEAWTGRIHPDDLPDVLAENRLVESHADMDRTYVSTYRIRNGRESWSLVRSVCKAMSVGADGSLEFVGMLEDISEHYEADRVTGGLSRRGFLARTGELVERMGADGSLAVLCLNIRRLKAFNALWGFEEGDRLLRHFHGMLQRSDLEPLLIGRKDDSFLCLVRWSDGVLPAIARVCGIEYEVAGRTVSMHAVCGVYRVEDPAVSPAGMIDRARLAWSHIEDEYVRPYAVFSGTMERSYTETALASSELRRALDEDQFQVLYQPIVDCLTGRVVSAEALVRWRHPERGMISPAVFIPAMERDGFVSAVDRHVVGHVWGLLGRRLDAGLPVVPVSVNLSWMDFYDGEFLFWLLKSARTGGYPDGFLRCEITESSYAALGNDVGEMFARFRESGVTMLLDDFGTGVSTLDVFQKYGFDILKVDMSFTRMLGTNDRTEVLLRGTISMCHDLGIRVVAEGVETREQLDFYRSCSCDYIQGYYFHRPLTEEAFTRLLSEQQDG